MSDLIEQMCSRGKGRFTCPSCGSTASDDLPYPYCPRGCTETEMEDAKRSEPEKCTDFGPGHDPQACLHCLRRRRWARERIDETEEERVGSMRVSGAHLLDLPPISPIWGTDPGVLSAQGQAWMLAGSDGTGKTTLAGQYAKARLGMADEMWKLLVAPLPPDQSVYFLAMDRPRQAMESLRRGLTEEMRPMLDQRLFVHPGPPPYRLSHSTGHSWMLREVEETNAGLVVLDSRKDAGNILDGGEVLGVATMVNLLVASDVEVLVLAHPNERRRNGPPDLSAVAGFGGVYQNMGSVLFLEGRPGDVAVTVHHLKPIRERLPSFIIEHDHSTGVSQRVAQGVVIEGDGDLVEGRMPSDRWEVKVLQCIDAHNSGEAHSASLKEVLGSDNLSRDLRGLVNRKVIEHNRLRGPQSGYRRGPEAPPRE